MAHLHVSNAAQLIDFKQPEDYNSEIGTVLEMLQWRAGTAMAVAAAHDVDPSKFLLIRKPSGQLSLRHLSGSFLVRTPPPPPPRNPPCLLTGQRQPFRCSYNCS